MFKHPTSADVVVVRRFMYQGNPVAIGASLTLPAELASELKSARKVDVARWIFPDPPVDPKAAKAVPARVVAAPPAAPAGDGNLAPGATTLAPQGGAGDSQNGTAGDSTAGQASGSSGSPAKGKNK